MSLFIFGYFFSHDVKVTKLFRNNLHYRLPRWYSGKESACNARDVGLIPGLGRYPRGGNGSLLQYSCLDNSMDRGAWWGPICRVAEIQT